MTKTREQFQGVAVGRIVQGDPWTAQEKDAQGNLRVVKSGPNAGQPNPQFFIAVAFPKLLPNPQTGVMENNPAFGEFYGILDRMARMSWPQFFPNNGACTRADFAWKVKDGDGYDANGKSNADKDGFAGCWIVSFASSYAPKIMQNRGGAFVQIEDPNLLKRGYYVRVAGSVASNESTQTPGLYVNFDLVEIIAPGEEIIGGMDPNQAFAQPAVLPPGVTAVPAGGAPAPLGAGATPPTGGLPVAGNAPPLASGAPGTTTPPGNPIPGAAASPPAPTGAAPVAGMTPQAGPAPGTTSTTNAHSSAPPAAPHAGFIPAPVMSAAAINSYEEYKAAGWTDEQLIANGLMIA